MVVGLSTRADERDVFEFFSGRAGVVKDVQIIRDARTGKSKALELSLTSKKKEF